MSTTYIWRDAQQQGPFTDHVFRALIADGTVTDETLVWREGQQEWVPFGTLGSDISSNWGLRLRIPPGVGPAKENLPEVLAALESPSGAISSTEIAIASLPPGYSSIETLLGALLFYRWPHVPLDLSSDLGLCPPDPDVKSDRTMENGILIPREELANLRQRAVEGDLLARMELSQILRENAPIRANPAVAAFLRQEAEALLLPVPTEPERCSEPVESPTRIQSQASYEGPGVAQSTGLRIRLHRRDDSTAAELSLTLDNVLIDPEEIAAMVARAQQGNAYAAAQLAAIYRENARQEADLSRANSFAAKAVAWQTRAAQALSTEIGSEDDALTAGQAPSPSAPMGPIPGSACTNNDFPASPCLAKP